MVSKVNEGFDYSEEAVRTENGKAVTLTHNEHPLTTLENGKSTEHIQVNQSEEKLDDSEKSKKKPDQVGVFQMFRFADRIDVLLMIIGSIAAVVCGLCLPIMIIVLGDMTNSFLNNDRVNLMAQAGTSSVTAASANVNTAYFNQTGDLQESMNVYAYYYIGIGVAVLISGYLMVSFWVWASARQTHKIRLAFYRAILRQDIGWYDVNNPGELATRLTDDLSKIQAGIGDKIALLIMGLSSFISGYVIGFVKGWELTLVILAFTPVLAFCGSLLVKFTTSLSSEESKAYAKAGAIAEEALSSIRTIAALGAEDRTVVRYSRNLDEAKRVGIRKGVTFGLGMGTTWLVIYISYCVAFWYGSKLVRDSLTSGQIPPRYDGGTVLMVFFAVLIGAMALGNASPSLNELATARGAAFFVYQVIDRQPPVDTCSVTGKKPSPVSGRIKFKDVGFSYPSRKDVPILRHLNITIDDGQTVALVGPSGCGKSTTIQLLQRFYDPDVGEVYVDGVKVRDWDINYLRDFIGVVSQEPVLFGTTISENIRYGRDGVTQAEIEAAARKANAHAFIMDLPLKYDTIVGERGSQMSGGQKQRIAIARAIVRDPKILLLDEATSALDAGSEKIVQDALDEARQGRTTIIIAHRLSTIRQADRIIVIDKGEVVEEGSHSDLMVERGLYHTLVTNQVKDDSKKDEDIDEEGPDVVPQTEWPSSARRSERKSVISLGTVSILVDPNAKDEQLVKVPMSRIFKLNLPEWPYILVGCLAAGITGAAQPAFAILFSEMIRVFVQIDMVKQERDALTFSLCFLAIGFGTFLSWFLQSAAFAVSGESLTVRIRILCFKSMLRQEIGWFDRQENNTGALTTRLATDASAVQGAAGIRIATVFQAATLLIASVAIAFAYSWKLTLVVLAFVPLVVMGGVFQLKVLSGQAGKNQKQLEQAGKVAYESIDNFRTVTTLGLQSHFYRNYSERLKVPLRNEIVKAHTYGISYSISQGVIYFAYAAAFTFGAYLIKQGEIDFPDVFRVFGALIFCAMGLGNVASFAPDGAKAQAAAGRVFPLLDRKPEIDSSSPDGKQPERLNGRIAFNDVRFSFPTRKSIKILRGVNLEIGAGQTLALVGHSGCGKSTTISLVERFYDAASGIVNLDGRPIEEYNIKWLRSQMGFVQQEPVLFSGTVKENITYGCSEPADMEVIIQAARDANIHDFVMNLPSQYDTHLGDRGSQLSGGQKQRIAIARAIIRNPKILLLDEATSALDTESEKIVQEALDRAQKGRTCIVIAHRLNTIQNADKICVISYGKVAEQGSHQHLMAMRGLYWKAFTTLSGGSS